MGMNGCSDGVTANAPPPHKIEVPLILPYAAVDADGAILDRAVDPRRLAESMAEHFHGAKYRVVRLTAHLVPEERSCDNVDGGV